MRARRLLVISLHGDPLASLGGVQSGGQNVYVRHLALHMQKLGWEVEVLTHWSDPEKPPEVRLGPRGRVVRSSGGRRGFIPKAQMAELVPAIVEEFRTRVAVSDRRYALVHSNYWLSGLAGLLLGRLCDVPQVHTSHSLGSVRMRETGAIDGRRLVAEREILSRVDAAVATTRVEAGEIRRFLGGTPRRMVCIPAGVDTSLFCPGDRASARSALGAKGPVILFVGRFEPAKGLAVRLQAVERLLRDPRNPSATSLWIVGCSDALDPVGAPRAPELAALADPLKGRVRFFGSVPHERLPLFFRAADVTAVPSFYESFGLVAAEATACGCPVVASAVGGLKEVVAGGKGGLLVPPRDPEALAEALGWVLRNPDLARALASRGAARAARRFAWPRLARRLDRLYGRLASGVTTLCARG